jgi:outer membrane protein assembly factor BamB
MRGKGRPLLIFLLFAAAGVQAQQAGNGSFDTVLSGGHRGPVNVLLYDEEGQILSAGEDGFLAAWDIRRGAVSGRFQLSPYEILSMVSRPGKPQITLIESDGLGLYRISAWDYGTKRNLFTLRFRDSVSYINYSGGGNFLIVARSGRTGVVFIHPETGEILSSPGDLTGSVGFAATGRSERTMISYQSSGVLSYWDLESGREIRRFAAPAQLASPLLFGNNRFFCGIDGEELVVLDAVSGETLAREGGLAPRALFAAGPESSEFLCLGSEYGIPILYRLGISGAGRLETRNRRRIPPVINTVTGAAGAGEEAVLGTADGKVWILGRNGTARSMATGEQRRIREAAASRSVLAFLDGENSLAFIPRDYTRLRANEPLRLERDGAYTRIAADPGNGGYPPEQFLLWQAGSTRTFPVIKTVEGYRRRDTGGDIILGKLPLRFPVISAALLGEEALFLDSVGNITVLSARTGDIIFSFSSISSLDAAFLDRGNIIVGRSAVSGNTPFLAVNIQTGETLPIAYPSSIGAKVYHSSSGTIYGAVIDQEPGNPKTSIIRINPSNPSLSAPLVEYQGEDALAGIAESMEFMASTLGGDGAAIYGPEGMLPFERGPGLPVRLIEGGDLFIVLDDDGNISWHDPQSGKLLALFRLYESEWILERPGEPLLRGPVVFDSEG